MNDGRHFCLVTKRFNLFQDNKISHIEGDEDDRRSAFAEVPLLESLALDGNEIR